MKNKVKAAAVAAVLAAGVLVAPAPASASARSGCGYPYVCIYRGPQTGRPSGRYRDVTRGWQWFSRSRGATSVVNTRHDDVAYLLTSNGNVICVPPRTAGSVWSGVLRAIRISYRSHC